MGNTLKTALLLTLLSGLLLLIGQWLGGQSGLVIAFAFALVMNFGSSWFSDKVVLRMYRATEVGPDHPLHQMTARLARRAQLPMPRVYVIPDQSPNACQATY
jgi:heat shock protein HtpX